MAASSWQAAPPMSGASWQLPPLQPRRVMIEHEVDEDSWTATLETEVKLNMAAARGSLELAASYDKAFVEIGRGLVLQHEWNRLHHRQCHPMRVPTFLLQLSADSRQLAKLCAQFTQKQSHVAIDSWLGSPKASPLTQTEIPMSPITQPEPQAS